MKKIKPFKGFWNQTVAFFRWPKEASDKTAADHSWWVAQVFQEEGTAYEKTLKQTCAWCIQRTARRPHGWSRASED
jgi:hypothetical protein